MPFIDGKEYGNYYKKHEYDTIYRRHMHIKFIGHQ